MDLFRRFLALFWIGVFLLDWEASASQYSEQLPSSARCSEFLATNPNVTPMGAPLLPGQWPTRLTPQSLAEIGASDDFRALIKQALVGMITIRDLEPSITQRSRESFRFLLSMGEPLDEIQALVRARLEKFLAFGRGMKLGPGAPNDVQNLLTSALTLVDQAQGAQRNQINSFAERYSLKSVSQAWSPLDRTDLLRTHSDGGSVSSSLPEAFALAAEAGLTDLMGELSIQMLQLGNWQGLLQAAEMISDDQALLATGILALADFYKKQGERFTNDNLLEDAIEALRRVQGEAKGTANRLLIDLADELALADNFEDLRYKSLALRALRATGALLTKETPHSEHVNFVTRVDDEDVRKKIQTIFDEYFKGHHDLRLLDEEEDEIRLALSAASDQNRLKRFAIELLTKASATDSQTRVVGFYEQAVKFNVAAGDFESAHDIIKGLRTYLGRQEDPLFLKLRYYEVRLPRLMQLAQDHEGLNSLGEEVDQIIRDNPGDASYGWQLIRENIRRAQAGLPIEKFDEIAQEVTHPLDNIDHLLVTVLHEEWGAIEELHKIVRKLTPEEAKTLTDEGWRLLGNKTDPYRLYHAQEKFRHALSGEGMVEVGKGYLDEGDWTTAFYRFLDVLRIMDVKRDRLKRIPPGD